MQSIAKPQSYYIVYCNLFAMEKFRGLLCYHETFQMNFWNDVLIWHETLKTVKVLQGMKVKTWNHEAFPPQTNCNIWYTYSAIKIVVNTIPAYFYHDQL